MNKVVASLCIYSLNSFCKMYAKNIIIRKGQVVGFGNDFRTGVLK